MAVYLHDDQYNGAAVMIKQTSAHVIPLPYEVSYEEVVYDDDEFYGPEGPRPKARPSPGQKQPRQETARPSPKAKKPAPRAERTKVASLQDEIAQMQTKLAMMAIVVDTLQTRERKRNADQRKPAKRG